MLKKVLAVLALVVVVALGTTAYLYLKPTETASQPIEAIPLVVSTATASEEATVASESENVEATSSEESAATLFEIIPEESEVRFVIDEVLNGSPKTVVGTTDQVAGQLAVDAQNVANTQIGVIQINARTLTTDNDMRNRAISNRILFTDEYEYITFTPTAITGLPESVNVGDVLTFQVTGDLTIRDVTLPATFDMQVTAVGEDRLEGTASTTIRYSDYDISIPEVPSVTNVEDVVELQLDFAAETV